MFFSGTESTYYGTDGHGSFNQPLDYNSHYLSSFMPLMASAMGETSTPMAPPDTSGPAEILTLAGVNRGIASSPRRGLAATSTSATIIHELACYRYSQYLQRWAHISLDTQHEIKTLVDDCTKETPNSAQIFYWNLDAKLPGAEERLKSALRHTEEKVATTLGDTSPGPCFILLRGVTRDAFNIMLEDEWVRQHFKIVPRSHEKWPEKATYGCVTLVSHSLVVTQASLIEFGNSKEGAMALAVSVSLGSHECGEQRRPTTLINTQLESEKGNDIERREQAKILRERCSGESGIVVGSWQDCGAYREGDLQDASDSGSTNHPHEKNQAASSKILYLPGKGYTVDSPIVIGGGNDEPEEATLCCSHLPFASD
ncbi:hypothetical protein CC1G_12162 [Coprinopsis cinerea okayama7|uniref:Uncharacterized protein n=1 Tax=Coprinopsis cinerea (strain Okayama-7 / 130 / ATCC MYA-4618 / FGSC 9003) TaxID=240176 RepID=A8N0C4_COPC7|nr:hypothetical protein CC1G_12162 [Coprinopsis cinerea okayama7\|eukprot:XP_001828321.1 hypothetical protein CC1G_12162 [Coprinopsis cinerea okayama7\